MTASCFRCLVDVVPVKNEDGVVIMFILNFEDLAQLIAKSSGRSLHHRLSQSWRAGGCHQDVGDSGYTEGNGNMRGNGDTGDNRDTGWEGGILGGLRFCKATALWGQGSDAPEIG